jgi:hypothetical protein
MKRRKPAFALSQAPTSAVRTGDHCPRSGWWYVPKSRAGSQGKEQYVSEGNLMPAVEGAPVERLPRAVAGILHPQPA